MEKLAEDLCLLGCFGALEEEDALSALLEDTKARPFADLLSAGLLRQPGSHPRSRAACRLSFWTAFGGAPSTCAGTWKMPEDQAGASGDPQRAEPGSDPQGSFKQWPDVEER